MKVLHAQQQQIAHQQAAAPTAPAVPAAPAPAPQQDGDTKKGAWTEEEDSALRHYIEVRKIRKRRKLRKKILIMILNQKVMNFLLYALILL